MEHYNYERLTALDNLFLVFESPTTPMHVGSAAVFETADLCTPGGGVDIDRIRQYTASRLHLIPRYRQRLARVPLEQRNVWVDDPHLDLDYHIPHTSLPKPGDEAQLKQLAANIFAQPLDLTRPLWETWVVEGLEDGRFALLFKVHHCMVDGVSGADLLAVLLTPSPHPSITPGPRWIPRAIPQGAELLRDQLAERIKLPVSLAAHVLRHPLAAASEIGTALAAVGESLAPTLRSASPTPFNQPIGAHRRFDWAVMDLAAIRDVKNAVDGTVNDVVLASVAGAVRMFLRRRGVDVSGITFRVFVPVSLRSISEHGALGNRVASWIVDLPLGERDPRQRLLQIRDTTRQLKQSHQARGAEVLTELAEWTSGSLVGMLMRLAAQTTLPFNLVVTNVPGPPGPLYLLGSRMQAVYPLVPLFVNFGMGVALFSHAGRLFWGFNADRDVMPDLAVFVEMLDRAFGELYARVAVPPPRLGSTGRPRENVSVPSGTAIPADRSTPKPRIAPATMSAKSVTRGRGGAGEESVPVHTPAPGRRGVHNVHALRTSERP